MPPGWLTILARHSIAARLVSAAVILYDIYARGRRRPVRVMEDFAIKTMSGLAPRQALARAIGADTLTVVAFEAGLFGWMALMFFVFFPTRTSSLTTPATG